MYGLQLKNSTGSAILMVSIFGVVVGSILFALFAELGSSIRMQKQLNNTTAYAQFILKIQNQLSWPDQCYVSLQNQVYLPSSNNLVSLQNFSYKNLPEIKQDLQLGSGLVVSSIVLKAKASSEFSSAEFALNASVKKWARNSFSRLTTRVAQLLITVKSNLGYSFKVIPINLFVNTDNQNRIKSCYTESSVAYVCESLQNVWNAQRGVCEPYRQCFYSGSALCENPYSLQRIGGSSYRVCEWCNPNIP